MTNNTINEDSLTAEQAAITRSRLYQLFALAMTYPNTEWSAAVRAGELDEALSEQLALISPTLATSVNHSALCDTGNDDQALAVEYTRLFDVGSGGAPISLYGGHHHGGRTQAMEEVLRFYQHFGLSLNQQPNELPDHLVSELEFLHFLNFQQAKVEAQGGDSGAFQRGQKDFLERQLGRWLPSLCQKLGEQRPLPYFSEVMRLLDLFIKHERQRLNPSLLCIAQ